MKLPLAFALVAVAAVSSHAGDPAAGKAKALACQACHASEKANAPHLVGQREKYLVKELSAFKSGDRKDDLMSAIAKQLSDADIANLAAYWAAQPTGSDDKLSDAAVKLTKPLMTFPKDFPKGFVVYTSETDPEHHTSTKSYANAAAITAAKAGKPLPDGSAVIVVNYGADDKATSYSGMEAHAGWGADVPPLLQNGNWSYNLWTADRTPKPDVNQAVCLACHKPASASSYVFTLDKIKTSH